MSNMVLRDASASKKNTFDLWLSAGHKEDNYKWEKRSRSRKNRRRGLVLFEKRSLGSSGMLAIFVINIRLAVYY